MPKRNIPSGEITMFDSSSYKEQEQKDKKHRFARAIGAFAVVGVSAGFFGGIAASAAPEAQADKCYVIGGMGDPSGEGAKAILGAQGQLNSCNEGVETIPYSASIWPMGPDRMVDSVRPAADDLTNRLNNTPPWQHKKVMGFSEGTEPAAQASNRTTGTNITFELNGGPQGRTGAFNSFLYNGIPLVRNIAGDIIGIADDTPLQTRPGIDIVKKYTKGDGYANLQPQGADVFALISMADMMVRMNSHRIPAPWERVVADFQDGDGVHNIVYDDGSPFTRTGEHDPSVINRNPGPAFPPLFPGMPPLGGHEMGDPVANKRAVEAQLAAAARVLPLPESPVFPGSAKKVEEKREQRAAAEAAQSPVFANQTVEKKSNMPTRNNMPKNDNMPKRSNMPRSSRSSD